MLQDSDEEKLSQIFMILFQKNVAKQSANDFEDSQGGKVVPLHLCTTLCNSLHSFLESWLLSEISFPVLVLSLLAKSLHQVI